jgi:hypothetical protein
MIFWFWFFATVQPPTIKLSCNRRCTCRTCCCSCCHLLQRRQRTATQAAAGRSGTDHARPATLCGQLFCVRSTCSSQQPPLHTPHGHRCSSVPLELLPGQFPGATGPGAVVRHNPCALAKPDDASDCQQRMVGWLVAGAAAVWGFRACRNRRGFRLVGGFGGDEPWQYWST